MLLTNTCQITNDHFTRAVLTCFAQSSDLTFRLPVNKTTLDVSKSSAKSFRHERVEDWVEDRVEVVENTWRKSKGRVRGVEGQMSQNNQHVFERGVGGYEYSEVFLSIFGWYQIRSYGNWASLCD